MNYLLVIAHPDDEVLAAGASIHKFTSNGDTADICIMCTEASARAFRPEDKELSDDLNASNNILGVRRKYEGSFKNIEMNNEPHLHLVQFIEKAIMESQPDVVITHHPCDTNNDHLHTSMACQAAIRLFQRRPEVKPLSELWFAEVLSSTEWSVNSSMNRFTPNLFVEVGKDGIDSKIRALETYRGVMRPYPHPRSDKAIEGLAAYRGAQSGCDYAEAFECVFRRIVK
ncbi:MAG: PIG-L family deacetylase [Clostridia bacterium]|nr:PIG-L family deacetylase [Clostridia bacterium]